MNEIEMQFKKQIKMKIMKIKKYNWNEFSIKNDLFKIDNKYWFKTLFKNKHFKGKYLSLLNRFLNNEITNSFFTKGKNELHIL